MQKINELQILTRGSVEIIGDYELQLKEAKEYCDSIEIAKIDNNKDYKQGFKFSKEIKEGQDKVKELITSLDNQEIINLKEKLIDINKILASKNTAIKKRLDEYKLNEKDIIIENGWANVTSQVNYEADFKLFQTYKQECLTQFKGKSKFEEMQTISLNLAEGYNNKLEIKYEKAFNELKKYCEEIGLAETDHTLELESKTIVLKAIDATEAKARLRSKMELQEKAVKDKVEEENTARVEAETKAKVEVEVAAEKPVQASPIIPDGLDIIDLKEIITVKITLNKTNFHTLLLAIKSNNIDYIELKKIRQDVKA